VTKGIEVEGEVSLHQRASPVMDRSRETVAQLLSISAKLLDDVGVDGFNTNLLAAQAGMRIRTVYRYFPNKFAIIATIARNISNEWDLALEPHFLRLENKNNSDWRSILRTLMRAWIQLPTNQLGGVAVAKAMSEAPELHSLDNEIFARTTDRIAQALIRRGISLPTVRVRAISRVFTLSVHAAVDLSLRLESENERRQLWRELTDMHVSNLGRYLEG
jgi:AcrR family transcriptional regulator